VSLYLACQPRLSKATNMGAEFTTGVMATTREGSSALAFTVFKVLPLQPTVSIDGDLQQIVHLPPPELERWEGVQSANA